MLFFSPLSVFGFGVAFFVTWPIGHIRRYRLICWYHAWLGKVVDSLCKRFEFYDKSFEGYIFTIAHRNVLDHIKKKATRERQITSPLSEGVQLISTLTAEDFIIKHQFDSVYYRAIESLPSKRKEIFILSRHNGMSNSEIAKQLDLSIKTVENQMTAAIASLKEFFKLSELGLIPFFYFFF